MDALYKLNSNFYNFDLSKIQIHNTSKQNKLFETILQKNKKLHLIKDLPKYLLEFKKKNLKSNFVENTIWNKLCLEQREELLKSDLFNNDFRM